ncbi:MAG: hypothetical protein IKU60_02535 [Clostridia bacterium]|nr:hypothetical protein [Clostridia bacterium]
MTLKEFLTTCGVIADLPHALPGLLARRDTADMASCLTLWHGYIGRFGEGVTFSAPQKMFDYYISQRSRRKDKLKSIMGMWWSEESPSGKTNGEALNEAVKHFFKKRGCDKAEPFNRESFTALFEDMAIDEPAVDFYDFFNTDTKTYIRYIGLPRTKNLPFAGSRRRICNRFAKSFFPVASHIEKIYADYYSTHTFDDKAWDEYITDIVADKISKRWGA